MAIPIAVARIIAITQGRTPERKALTPAYFIRFLSTAAVKSIIMKDGRTTPSVARNEPRMPPYVEPINVAILTASGPGVDSETAIKFKNSLSVSQPFEMTVSLTRETIPYPPPKSTGMRNFALLWMKKGVSGFLMSCTQTMQFFIRKQKPFPAFGRSLIRIIGLFCKTMITIFSNTGQCQELRLSPICRTMCLTSPISHGQAFPGLISICRKALPTCCRFSPWGNISVKAIGFFFRFPYRYIMRCATASTCADF